MKEQAGCCYYCGQPMWSDDDAAFRAQFNLTRRRALLFQCTAEHLKARSEGGASGRANLVAACWFCNQTRHRAARAKAPDAYRAHVRRRLALGRWQQLGAPIPC